MKVFFDTSVLVPAVTDQLPNHPAALACLVSRLKKRGAEVMTSSHALTECYATLTALPLPRRITGPEAVQLIETNFLKRLRILNLTQADTLAAIKQTSASGGISGRVYDALHVVAARKADCRRIYTYNLDHFRLLASDMEITTP